MMLYNRKLLTLQLVKNHNKKYGVLHDCVAEIIPIELDAGNAAAGNASTALKYVYIYYNVRSYFYSVSSYRAKQQIRLCKTTTV